MRLSLLAGLVLLGVQVAAQTAALDPTFGTGGRVSFDPSGMLQSGAEDVAVLPDGRILLAGRVGPDAAVLRLTEAGALDPTFGDGGVRRVDLGGSSDTFAEIERLPDGSLVAVGMRSDADDIGLGAAVVRLTASGAVDAGFGVGGIVHEAAGVARAFRALVVQPDGRIVAVGWLENVPAGSGSAGSGLVAIRYLPDGARDASFGISGRAAPATVTAGGKAVALDASGRLTVTGTHITGPGNPFPRAQIQTARLTGSGSLDEAFGEAGVVVAALPPAYNTAFAITVDPLGRSTVCGFSTSSDTGRASILLLRYTASGTPDGAFGTSGVVRTTSFGPSVVAFDLALQADGKLLVAGLGAIPYRGFLLVRYTSDGALDMTFGVDGAATARFGKGDEVAFALAFEANGRVVLAGERSTQTGPTTVDRQIAVARFVTDGRPVAGDTPPAGADVFALTASPNPFGGQTAVTLALAEAGAARVAVYDALGRLVAVLHDGPLAAGERAFRVDGSGLAPGLYVVRAEGAGGGVSVRIVRR